MGVIETFQLNGKIALVTGASRGIGKAMAIALAEAGADIIGVSKQLNSDNSTVEQEITAIGRKFWGHQCDLSQRKELYNLIEKIKADCPTIDILVNNAGTIKREKATTHPDNYWDETVEVNLTAPFILSREIGKAMVERGSGKIIFTASLLTFQGGINVPSYASSKGGVGQLTKALANEWASTGVQVNGIVPGYIATDNTEALRNDPERSESILERIPANRWGEPSDFKGPVVFLASSASDYVHGTLLVVDGGWLSR